MTGITYLTEFRKRVFRSLVAILFVFLPLCYFSKELYTLLALPLLKHLPEGSQLIATNIASTFLAPFKFALITAVFVAMPYLLQQAWGFIAPAMYKHEKQFYWPLLLISVLLFYSGVLFAYFAVFPLVFQFFIGVTPSGVKVLPDITHYLNFALSLFFAFGIAFEMPILTVLLIKTGICTEESLKNKRPYIIVGAFVIGMLLTPPDIISQILLALPIWLLFETGLLLARLLRIKPLVNQQLED